MPGRQEVGKASMSVLDHNDRFCLLMSLSNEMFYMYNFTFTMYNLKKLGTAIENNYLDLGPPHSLGVPHCSCNSTFVSALSTSVH